MLVETKRKLKWESLFQTKWTFKIKNIIRDKEEHYIMIKGSIQEEDITFINVYTPNIRAPHYVRQTLTGKRGEINSNTIIGNFNTPLLSMDKLSKQRINKEIQILSETLDQRDLIDIFMTFYPNA